MHALSLKRKERCFYVCKLLMLDIQIQCELLKSYWDRIIVTSIISSSRSLQTPNFIVLFLWITRDQIFSWFPLKESTGCLMRVATHTPTTEIPHILTWFHHMVLLREWIEIHNISDECDLLHFLVSPFSQNPQSSHYPACTLSSKWTHCTLSLKPPSYQR
jgi:hypothetical protein